MKSNWLLTVALAAMTLASFAAPVLADTSTATDASVTYVPSWSDQSYADAMAQCTLADPSTGKPLGAVVGHTMETTTATGQDFYISVCQRPEGSGVTYTLAWSATSIQDSQNRCTRKSTTTGLPAGTAVGDPIHAQASSTDIFIVVCERFEDN